MAISGLIKESVISVSITDLKFPPFGKRFECMLQGNQFDQWEPR